MITIIDYGLGNLRAFANIYKSLNINFQLASNVDELNKANKIILPGVGSFDHAMTKLNNSGLRNCLENLVLKQKIPVIGICVGMQMMAYKSEEGVLDGLGWVKGEVKSLSNTEKKSNNNLPLPHMGWNSIKIKKRSTLFNNLDEYKNLYFLHSFYFQCQNSENVIATTSYGHDFPSIIKNNNIYGVQCHPEKSHHNGIQVLKNFAELN